jgi:enoyl-CoA hydratase/carnithine racemase
LVLQGVGAHFCTGGRLEKGAPDHSGLSIHDALGHLNIGNEVAMRLRKLLVATTAAVHGKLIGGGVALSLAAQYRISSQEATFNFGNLPRGMNPLFMLSRSLALVAGW